MGLVKFEKSFLLGSNVGGQSAICLAQVGYNLLQLLG